MLEDVPASYKPGVTCFLRFLEKDGGGLTFRSLKKFSANLRTRHNGRTYSASTINVYIAAVVSRVRKLIKARSNRMTMIQGYAFEGALSELKREKIASSAVEEDKVLSYTEIRKLIAECSRPEISLMMEFLAFSAVRVSEMLQILLTDIKRVGDYSGIRIHGKGNKERKINVETALLDRIKKQFAGKEFLFEHHGRRYTRGFVSMRISQYGNEILGREISAHTFRHSWATHAIKHGARTNSVQEKLGHSSPATTLALYVHDRFTWKEEKDLFRE